MNMKKIFGLLMLIVALVTTQGAYAQKTYEISSTTKTADNGGTWTFVSEKQTFTVVNTKSKGYATGTNSTVKYSSGTDFTLNIPEGMNVEKVTFTGYTNDAKTNANLLFNGTEYKDKTFPLKDAGTTESYTLDWPQTDGKSNSSAVFRFNGKQACMTITITEAASDKLSAPTFSYDEVAGKVTISATGAKEVRYTTDGSEPSATNGTVYTEPFDASNITVKAIAISDGTKTNSDVATYQVPAKLLSTILAITKVTIAGTELSAEDLQKLITDKTLTLTEEYAVAPEIIFTKTTTKKYDGDTYTNTDETETATVTRNEDAGIFTTSTTVDGVTYTINLPIKKDVEIAKPTISSVNGTVVIKCATEGVKLSYKIGDGEYQDYIHSFTLLDEDAVVTAKASLEGSTDAISDPYTVEVVKNTVKTKRIVFDNSMFTLTDNVKGTSNAKLTGNAGTDADGYWMELNNNQKNFSTGSDITVDGTKYKSIKGSNGAENILYLPDGVKASRFIIYSYVNQNAPDSKACGWSKVNGDQDYQNVPSESYKDAENPDVRVFPIAADATQIAFNNAGYQMCFVFALDIIDEPAITTADIAVGDLQTTTYSNAKAWQVPAGVEIYTATYAAGKVTLHKVEESVVPANTGVIVFVPKGTYTANLTTTEAAELANNDLKQTAAEAVTATGIEYALVREKDASGAYTGKACFGKMGAGQTIAQNKAYLEITDQSAAKTLSIGFEETDGISAATAAEKALRGDCYTLDGKKAQKPEKGIYIMNGKKFTVR